VGPSRREAFRFWLKLGFISFGGPAGQIAIMHREVVERRRWLADGPFMQALNCCMLLPGPEALQLAIWIGWRLHGVAGGIVAGLCFIGPAMAILMGLSFVYALHGELPPVAAALLGLQATVIALIAQALLKLARRALLHPLHWLLAAAAFAVMVGRFAPFPLLLALAALVGLLVNRGGGAEAIAPPRERARFPRRVLATGFALWVVPAAAILALAGRDTLFADVYRFFTTAALLTFGGAYAILAWVSQQAVEVQAWLTQAQAVAGLALAETTPGPLIIVLQFFGFMAGWNQAAGVDAPVVATATALLAAWATFLPAFVIILVAAPYVEQLSANRRVAGALAGITAAVVGVIGSLAIVFGRGVLFPEGMSSPAWGAIAISGAAFVVLERTRVDVLWVIAGGAVAGLLLGMA
jgi:chromate transporter